MPRVATDGHISVFSYKICYYKAYSLKLVLVEIAHLMEQE